MESIRGLSTRSKVSLTEIKPVVAGLETDITEIKNTVSSTIIDLYDAKMGALADKITT